MIPAFGRDGLLPVGEHPSDWEEFVARFSGTPDNGRRRKLMLGLAQMLFLLNEAECRVVWIDGSFVTRERWPKDFDLCYDPQRMSLDLLSPELRDVSQGRAAQKRRFGGEALAADFPFEANSSTVREAFMRTREGETKGIVRLELTAVRSQLVQFLLDNQLHRENNNREGNPHGTP